MPPRITNGDLRSAEESQLAMRGGMVRRRRTPDGHRSGAPGQPVDEVKVGECLGLHPVQVDILLGEGDADAVGVELLLVLGAPARSHITIVTIIIMTIILYQYE